MVTPESVEKQLKDINFNHFGWGRSEAKELPHILMPTEEIFEVVNGFYEGGFALLVATNVRMLLIDKKPMNYLTVEDLRFDMISEIDYAHRLLGARISISTGSKLLKFTSYNQARLRKLISHVQDCMAEAKNKHIEQREDQKQHLEKINQQLQAYLIAQHQNQQKIQNALESKLSQAEIDVSPVRPSHELSDYLYAQSLLSQHQATKDQADVQTLQLAGNTQLNESIAGRHSSPTAISSQQAADDIYSKGVQEIFGKRQITNNDLQADSTTVNSQVSNNSSILSFDINPLKIAYSMLPLVLRNRRFGRSTKESEIATVRPITAQ